MTATVAPDQEPNPRFAQFMGDPETFRIAIPGQSFGVKVHVVNQGATPATLRRVSVESGTGPAWNVTAPSIPQSADIANGKPMDLKFSVNAPDDAAFTRPYFSRPDIEQSYYDVKDERYLNQPLSPYSLIAWAEFSYEGVPVRLGQYVQSVKRVTGLGTVLEPLVTAPAIGIAISPRSGVVPLDAKSFEVTTVIHSNVKGPANGTVRLDLPAGWRAKRSQPRS